MTGDATGGHSVTGSTLGRRRLDRVLAPAYLENLHVLSLEELRDRRREAEQGEADLSFLRRMVHARIDILRAELARRAGGRAGPLLIDELPAILADRPPNRPGLRRHLAAGPSYLGEYRCSCEQLVADVNLSDLAARTDAELSATLDALTSHERVISQDRRAAQQVVDACREEIARRYQVGEARVADLLRRNRR